MVSIPWRPQGDGSPSQWVNCSLVAAGRVWRQAFQKLGHGPATNTGSWGSAITKLTLGWKSALPTMASAMRGWILTHYGITGGVTIPKSFEAAKALWGAITGSGYRWDVPFSDLVAYVRAGRAVHTIIDYRVVHGTGYDGAPSFSGQAAVARHSIAICAGGVRLHNWTDAAGVAHSRWELFVYDSMADHRRKTIPQGPQWWPLSLVEKGAGGSIGVAGQCEFGYGPDVIP